MRRRTLALQRDSGSRKGDLFLLVLMFSLIFYLKVSFGGGKGSNDSRVGLFVGKLLQNRFK